MNLIDFGNKILRSRQNAGLTQEELALRIGVTPQAVSRWERNQSMPDILLFSDLCRVLNVSADSFLDTTHSNITGEYDSRVQEEIFDNINHCNEPLEILVGIGLTDVWENKCCVAQVAEQRRLLSQDGFLLPVVRIRDDCRLRNRDIVKLLTDNLKQKYPALIESTVPQRISYGLLTDVLKHFVRHQNSPSYLPQIIEIMDSRLREHPGATAEELAAFAEKALIGEDNLEILLAARNNV